VLLHRVEQHRRLDAVAGAVGLLLDRALRDRLGHRRDDEVHAQLAHPPVPELQDVGEVEAGVDVHDREGDAGGGERLARQLQHHDRVLAAGEQQHGSLELGDDLADHVDGLGLERIQLAQPVIRRRPVVGSGHANSSVGRGRRTAPVRAAGDFQVYRRERLM
jgi:hypothetical protein